MLVTFCTDFGSFPENSCVIMFFLLIKETIHKPLKSGLRFSTNAFTPSFASSDPNIFL